MQKKCKMNLEHIKVSLTKDMLKNQTTTTKMEACHRDTGVNLKAFKDESWKNLSNKINNVVLENT